MEASHLRLWFWIRPYDRYHPLYIGMRGLHRGSVVAITNRGVGRAFAAAAHFLSQNVYF